LNPPVETRVGSDSYLWKALGSGAAAGGGGGDIVIDGGGDRDDDVGDGDGHGDGDGDGDCHNVGDDGGRWGGLSPDTGIGSGPKGTLGGMNTTALYLEAMEAGSLPNLKHCCNGTRGCECVCLRVCCVRKQIRLISCQNNPPRQQHRTIEKREIRV